MKKFVIQNREVFLVEYLVEAETVEDAFSQWTEGDGEQLDSLDYLCDLAEYGIESEPKITEIL